jgi:hypothetical protein
MAIVNKYKKLVEITGGSVCLEEIDGHIEVSVVQSSGTCKVQVPKDVDTLEACRDIFISCYNYFSS